MNIAEYVKIILLTAFEIGIFRHLECCQFGELVHSIEFETVKLW